MPIQQNIGSQPIGGASGTSGFSGKSGFSGAAGGGGGSYLVYTALLTQSGDAGDPPIATVLENTLGGTPVWTWDGESGKYLTTLNGAFPSGKTVIFIGQGYSGMSNSPYVFSASRSTGDVIVVGSFIVSADTVAASDGLLNATAIEIRVYP